MKIAGGLFAAFVVYLSVMAMGFAAVMAGGGEVGASPGSFQPGVDLGLDEEQIRNATISLKVADRLHAPPLAVLAEITAALGESNLRVRSNAQGSGYCGVYQAWPDNIPCDDTEEQATRFLLGGKGFQAGGAIHLSKAQPGLSPGTIATLVEASGQPGSWYDVNLNGGAAKAKKIIDAWRSGGSLEDTTTSLSLDDVNEKLTPKQVIDRVILPIARDVGIQITANQVEAANAAHSVTTTSGNTSEHKGPPDVAWAADISDNWVTTVGSPKMTKLAETLSKTFGIPWTGSGLSNHEVKLGPCRFRFQMIYLTMTGGNHYNHVHLGVHALGCS